MASEKLRKERLEKCRQLVTLEEKGKILYNQSKECENFSEQQIIINKQINEHIILFNNLLLEIYEISDRINSIDNKRYWEIRANHLLIKSKII